MPSPHGAPVRCRASVPRRMGRRASVILPGMRPLRRRFRTSPKGSAGMPHRARAGRDAFVPEAVFKPAAPGWIVGKRRAVHLASLPATENGCDKEPHPGKDGQGATSREPASALSQPRSFCPCAPVSLAFHETKGPEMVQRSGKAVLICLHRVLQYQQASSDHQRSRTGFPTQPRLLAVTCACPCHFETDPNLPQGPAPPFPVPTVIRCLLRYFPSNAFGPPATGRIPPSWSGFPEAPTVWPCCAGWPN